MELEKVQEQLQSLPEDLELATKEKEARKTYTSILSSSLALIKQQSKMDWISYGDDNTRLFHTKIKQRKLATYSYTPQDEHGNQVEGFNKVGQVMLNYYKHLLGSHTEHRKRIDPVVIAQGPALSMEQQIWICKDFSDREIKEAIFSIPDTESPGPDGFSNSV
ncbi:hypothetical protein Cgig2_025401 [Carnegiea gigantea]|uniref:Uncharacterized protein n=1 Tax=Carnegiea gigantea TaxID=171969 RepID=A0A9Q1GGP8_9CARY|nr:hypothetical protein Cgig2_025401 [Carnegiea gigantea]